MPLSLDVGCGYLSAHKKRGDIGIDRVKVKCDICCDAQVLPLRSNLFDTVYLMAILEHLENPLKCIWEIIRVSKKYAVIYIEIPQITNTPKWRLFKTITEFPFGFLALLKWLIKERYNPYKHLGHKTIISLEWLMKYFNIITIERGGRHSWFYGTKGKILRRLGIKDRTRQASWKIKASVKR